MSENKQKRVETLGEYLARGGTIQKVETQVSEKKEVTVKSTTVGPANLYSLEEGANLFSERNKSSTPKEEPKKVEKEDILNNPDIKYDLLDEELKRKLGI